MFDTLYTGVSAGVRVRYIRPLRSIADSDLLGPCRRDGADGKLGKRIPTRVGARAFEAVGQALATRCRHHARTRVGETCASTAAYRAERG